MRGFYYIPLPRAEFLAQRDLCDTFVEVYRTPLPDEEELVGSRKASFVLESFRQGGEEDDGDDEGEADHVSQQIDPSQINTCPSAKRESEATIETEGRTSFSPASLSSVAAGVEPRTLLASFHLMSLPGSDMLGMPFRLSS